MEKYITHTQKTPHKHHYLLCLMELTLRKVCAGLQSPQTVLHGPSPAWMLGVLKHREQLVPPLQCRLVVGSIGALKWGVLGCSHPTFPYTVSIMSGEG